MPGWEENLVLPGGDGTAVTGVVAGSLLRGEHKIVLAAGYFSFIGKKLHLTATGRISNIVTTPGTLTFDIRFGSILVAVGPAFQLNAVAKTNVSWILDLILECRAVGAGTAANLLTIGFWKSESVVGSPLPSAGGAGELLWPASAPAVGNGFDSTAAQLVDLFATFSLTGNSIQLHMLTLESLTSGT